MRVLILRNRKIRLCQHSGLKYIGMYSVQDEDNLASFQIESAGNGAAEFAEKILQAL